MNRSNVTLIIAKPSYNEMLRLFKERSAEDSDYEYAYNLVTKDVDKKIEDGDFVSLFWSYIKWYSSFSDVSKVTEFLEACAEAIEMREEITEDLVKQYGWEIIDISDNGHVEFDCYDRDEGYEGEVFGMPGLYSISETYNELEEDQQEEDIAVYTVSALHRYMDNQFEIFNEILLTTTSELKAKIKLKEAYEYNIRIIKEDSQFEDEDEIFELLNFKESYAEIYMRNDDCIELSITKTTLQK